MNYRLIIAGKYSAVYDECLKLLIYTAKESDYILDIKSQEKLCPQSPNVHIIEMQGNKNKDYHNIYIDFDELISPEESSKGILLSPATLAINHTPNGIHYWAVISVVFKVITDISPAYILGYLLEKNKKRENEYFDALSTSIPFAVQVAINEFLTDLDK